MSYNLFEPARSGKHLIIPVLGIFLFIFSFNNWEIPVTWDVKAIKNSHLPPPAPGVKVEYAPKAYYDSLPEHVIYQTYPVYAQDYEPSGYLDSLKKIEPKIAFNLREIKTQEDWIRAGEQVFFWPPTLNTENSIFSGKHLDSAYLATSGDKITKEGIYPFAKYTVIDKGVIRYGDLSCATCHSRVMDNGEVIIGAQGNHAFDAGFGYIAKKFKFPAAVVKAGFLSLSGTPWASNYMDSALNRDAEVMLADLMETPLGVMSRQGMAHNLPLRVPSLIGIKDIKYLDITGLMLHRGPEDLMRYAALNQGMDMLTAYDGFIPLDEPEHVKLPSYEDWNHPFGYDPKRYSDAQLYALTQFIYSLKPPENPNEYPQELLDRGERIFNEQGCVTCHTPPLYTNNMLTPVDGFEPPPEHFEKYDIFNISVETDPRTALYSRRGTGYYKIPSLRGLWFRGPFFHNGELATLEDVFDPARLEPDYVPTGFKPSDVEHQAVGGHDFAMDLDPPDKEALIAYLKTL